MSYIQFDKTKLINLEYSLNREIIRSSRSGAYASTTIVGANTRKYHGLLVAPQPGIDDDLHVLLASMDETIIQRDAAFNLALRKYPDGNWNPKGHKYIRDFASDPIPTQIYRVGGVVLKKELLLVKNADQTLIRYTLLDAHSPTTLRFMPFLAFRSRHSLCKSNIYVDSSYREEKAGISMRLYIGYSNLYMQFSKEPAYVHNPNWYYNIEYIREQERGYDFTEDQFVPGYFELPIKKGESIVFSASTQPVNPDRLKALFSREVKSRIPRNSFINCMINSAQQFVVERNRKADLVAGYPWHAKQGRDTFISLPGIALETGNHRLFRTVMQTMVTEMRGPLFPQSGTGQNASYQAVDTPLWFFWAIHQYTLRTSDYTGAWKLWGDAMRTVLEGYIAGTAFHIRVNDLGLIEAGDRGTALTWMDSIVGGQPVTPRNGMAVEVNALWYNALMFYSFLAEKNADELEQEKYVELALKVRQSFREVFWNHRGRYLYDCVDGDFKDETIRPNQLLAVSLPFRLMSDEESRQILDLIRTVLLTTRGVRSLSPHHPDYRGDYVGDVRQRDLSAHQGAAWPWLTSHFIEAWLGIYGAEELPFVEKLFALFDDAVKECGLGTISELYEGNPPHRPGGSFSFARSVAEMLRIYEVIKRFSNANSDNEPSEKTEIKRT